MSNSPQCDVTVRVKAVNARWDRTYACSSHRMDVRLAWTVRESATLQQAGNGSEVGSGEWTRIVSPSRNSRHR